MFSGKLKIEQEQQGADMALLDLFSGRRASRAGRPKRSRKLTSKSLRIKRKRMAIQQLVKYPEDADPSTRMQMTAEMLEIRLALEQIEERWRGTQPSPRSGR